MILQVDKIMMTEQMRSKVLLGGCSSNRDQQRVPTHHISLRISFYKQNNFAHYSTWEEFDPEVFILPENFLVSEKLSI